MGLLLVAHLATLGTLYLTAPYTKFAHFAYRYAALVRNRIEVRREQAMPPGEGAPPPGSRRPAPSEPGS